MQHLLMSMVFFPSSKVVPSFPPTVLVVDELVALVPLSVAVEFVTVLLVESSSEIL